ncbi:MAG: SAM-dependent methyltransferase [Pseudomonadota bacterium]
MNTPTRAAASRPPPPDPAAAAHSQALVQSITDELRQSGGWLPFSRYMELALYAPGLGYYSSGARKFGEDGDFVTAPEISPLFARCLATQVADVLTTLGGGELLEFGAGTGVMAADMLLALETLDALPRRYSIVEVSADLKNRQQATLRERCPALADRVHWLDSPPTSGFRGVMVGNEVLDALPVDCFEVAGHEVQNRGVSLENGHLQWQSRPADNELVQAVRNIEALLGQSLPDGYRGECCLRLSAWLQTATAGLEAGVLLLADYGLSGDQLYLPERNGGTLACHYRHRFHDDPFFLPGLNDITAWVDFSAVGAAATEAGLSVAGFSTQAHFLFGCDLEGVLAAAMASDASTTAQLSLAREVKQLTLPGEMGERFKVIGLVKDYSQPLRGFGLRELSL